MKCVLCSSTVLGRGHNASPLHVGRCCDVCNDTKVSPARLGMAASAYVRPEQFTSDVDDFSWGNSLHRTWHVLVDSRWYRSGGERTAAGTIAIREQMSNEQVTEEIAKHNLYIQKVRGV